LDSDPSASIQWSTATAKCVITPFCSAKRLADKINSELPDAKARDAYQANTGDRQSISGIPMAFSCKSRRRTGADQTYGDQIHGEDSVSRRVRLQPVAIRSRAVVLSGHAIAEYDITGDDSEVVFRVEAPDKTSSLWVAPLDGSAAPSRMAKGGALAPHFGPNRDILFVDTDGGANHIARVDRNGSNRRRIAPFEIATITAGSPDGSWVVVLMVTRRSATLKPHEREPMPSAWMAQRVTSAGRGVPSGGLLIVVGSM
jgi:hypothetical protein